MSTDLLSERRITLTALAREQGVAVSTAWRWCLRGIHGRRLESLTIGGRRYTTREAFERWFERTQRDDAPAARGDTNRQRQAAIKRAERELREAGV